MMEASSYVSLYWMRCGRVPLAMKPFSTQNSIECGVSGITLVMEISLEGTTTLNVVCWTGIIDEGPFSSGTMINQGMADMVLAMRVLLGGGKYCPSSSQHLGILVLSYGAPGKHSPRHLALLTICILKPYWCGCHFLALRWR